MNKSLSNLVIVYQDWYIIYLRIYENLFIYLVVIEEEIKF